MTAGSVATKAPPFWTTKPGDEGAAQARGARAKSVSMFFIGAIPARRLWTGRKRQEGWKLQRGDCGGCAFRCGCGRRHRGGIPAESPKTRDDAWSPCCPALFWRASVSFFVSCLLFVRNLILRNAYTQANHPTCFIDVKSQSRRASRRPASESLTSDPAFWTRSRLASQPNHRVTRGMKRRREEDGPVETGAVATGKDALSIPR